MLFQPLIRLPISEVDLPLNIRLEINNKEIKTKKIKNKNELKIIITEYFKNNFFNIEILVFLFINFKNQTQ